MPDVGQNIMIATVATAVAEIAIIPQVITIGTAIGTFFAPSTTAAAGGAAAVIAASFAGSLITLIPATLGIIIAGLMLLIGLNFKSQALINLGIIVGLLDLVGTYVMAAKIGAAITGAAASSVLICNLIGAAAMLLAVTVAVGIVALGVNAAATSFAEAITPGALSR
ncbi:MAG: hypothetical protein NTU48_00655 [Legionellales bacterium]|nr:hypothetical protein [Legionellales bacterium]